MVLMNLFSRQQWRNRHREQNMDTGRVEERVRCMERVTWKLTISHVKYIVNGNLLLCLMELEEGLCINLEQRDGKEDGRET